MDLISINELNATLLEGKNVTIFVSSRRNAQLAFEELGTLNVDSWYIHHGIHEISVNSGANLTIFPWYKSHEHQMQVAKNSAIVAIENENLFTPEQNSAAEKYLSGLGIKFCKLA